MQSEFIQNSLGAYEVHTGDFSREFVEKISNAQDEPNWMRERRLEAYSVYETLPMPHTTPDAVWRQTTDMRTQDYWRRTTRHMRGLKLDGFQPVALSPSGPSRSEFRSTGE